MSWNVFACKQCQKDIKYTPLKDNFVLKEVSKKEWDKYSKSKSLPTTCCK